MEVLQAQLEVSQGSRGWWGQTGASPRGFEIPQIPGAGWGVPHPARMCIIPLDPAAAKGHPERGHCPPGLHQPWLCHVLTTTGAKGL